MGDEKKTVEENKAAIAEEIAKEQVLAEEVVCEMINEYAAAQKQNGNWNSLHEGWGVLSEEFDELWDEIKLKPHKRDYHNLKHEALQVAAMGLKMAIHIEREQRRKK